MEYTSWPESLPSNRTQAMQALTQGQELMDILREMIWMPRIMIESNSTTAQDDLVVQIQQMFENTLSIMSSCSSNNNSFQFATSELHSPCSSDDHKSKSSNESNLKTSVTTTKVKRGCYKRRKNSWTSTEVASFLVDDGHAWRKYGQKHIQNSEHQRCYYRCTYKFDQGCEAMKQVQQIQEYPPQFKTTYSENHTCKNLQREPTIILDSLPNPRDTSILLSFGTTDQFVEKKQVINQPNYRPIKHEQKTMCNSRHNAQVSSKSYPIWDSNTFVSNSPLTQISMTPSILDHMNMISTEAYSYMGASTNSDHEMNHMFQRDDYNDFPYELCF
ncbi:probable WRKY transcription factor 70 [Rutidosis leptorrhynchoides]|uniref:probable WRKY transcription factor 70 n=1 Tax=Rutidosis leptorrhynchoides TaxID=125765 RepID=UPI003A9A5467